MIEQKNELKLIKDNLLPKKPDFIGIKKMLNRYTAIFIQQDTQQTYKKTSSDKNS